MEREVLEIRAGRNIIIIISANTAEHVRQIWPNMFGQYGRTGSANKAERVRPYWPNLGRTVRFGRT